MNNSIKIYFYERQWTQLLLDSALWRAQYMQKTAVSGLLDTATAKFPVLVRLTTAVQALQTLLANPIALHLQAIPCCD